MSESVRIAIYCVEKVFQHPLWHLQACYFTSLQIIVYNSLQCIIKNLALDSEEALKIENKFPRKFHNLNVWIGDPVLAPAKAIIRNICVKTASEPPADSNVTIARVSNEFVELFYELSQKPGVKLT